MYQNEERKPEPQPCDHDPVEAGGITVRDPITGEEITIPLIKCSKCGEIL